MALLRIFYFYFHLHCQLMLLTEIWSKINSTFGFFLAQIFLNPNSSSVWSWADGFTFLNFVFSNYLKKKKRGRGAMINWFLSTLPVLWIYEIYWRNTINISSKMPNRAIVFIVLRQGLANFLYKKPEDKYFRFCRLHSDMVWIFVPSNSHSEMWFPVLEVGLGGR